MDSVKLSSFMTQWLLWLTGPVFDKELRVCSRRKRYYVMRTLYLAIMAILVLAAWLTKNATLGWQRSAYNMSRMAEVGRTVIVTVTWFQFIVSQLVTILFFSNAICDEMNRGTLNVLMTTPITALQIVMGKLLSKLILLVLILTLSLSTLSIVYAFGGVHWEYIISSFSVTLTAVIFTGALTLFCSGRIKHPHTVILLVITLLSIYYALGSALIAAFPSTPGKIYLIIANPMSAMYEISRPAVSGAVISGGRFPWGTHCGIMLAVSGALVGITVIGLRKSIMSFAFENRHSKNAWSRFKSMIFGRPHCYPLELPNLPASRPRRLLREWILLILLLSGYATAYVCLYFGRNSFGQAAFSAYTQTVWLVVFIRTIIAASTAITKEKENKTLSALLCCPLNNSRIIMGKAKQVYRSNYAGWTALMINAVSLYIFYSLFIYTNTNFASGYGGLLWVSVMSVLNVIGSFIFIVGFGLYLSVRLKSSTVAVVAGLVGYLLWYFLRHIFMLIPIVLSTIAGFYMISFYFRPLVDVGAGLFLMWRANRSLRNYTFR